MIAAKDWKQYWRYPLNAFSQVMNPLIFLSPVYFLGQAFSVNGQAKGFEAYSGTSDYISFILLGTVLNNFIMTVFWGIGYALKNDMDAGVLESNWLMPISRPLLLVGRTLTSLLITTLTSLGMLLVAGLLFGFHPTGIAHADRSVWLWDRLRRDRASDARRQYSGRHVQLPGWPVLRFAVSGAVITRLFDADFPGDPAYVWI
jgi:hypothetical protein